MVSLGAAKVKPSNSYHQQTFRQIKISIEPSLLHRVEQTKTSSAYALEVELLVCQSYFENSG
tara:strand:- start:31 stop:216 length:186 start_codon:yes stop_codon:yes gene_type:complete